MSSDRHRGTAIRAAGLGKRYLTGRTEGLFRYRSLREELSRGARRARRNGGPAREFWALRDVSFEVAAGEAVGIIGRNGAGKSTLLKVLSGITPPSTGRAEVRGRVGSLLEVGTGFHPELTGLENIQLNGAILGMRRAELAAKVDAIVDFAGIGSFLETPVKRYSSGMYLRLAFAVAAHLEPEVLLVDEVLAVGDVEFQRKCLGRMAEIGEDGRTVIFVSHSMPAILRLCDRVILLDDGGVVADGRAHEVVRTYLDTGLGTSAERAWTPEREPGDEVVRLTAVRVCDGDGRVADEVDVTDPVSVEVSYRHCSEDPRVRPYVSAHFYNEDGVCLFLSADFADRDWWERPRRPGLVTARCNIPGNLLAEGKVFVRVSVSSLDPTAVHVDEPDAVAFQVLDRSDGEGVRGPYANDWPGVVRPSLAWDVRTEEATATAPDPAPSRSLS